MTERVVARESILARNQAVSQENEVAGPGALPDGETPITYKVHDHVDVPAARAAAHADLRLTRELAPIDHEDMLGPFFMANAPMRSTTFPTGTSPEIQKELAAVRTELGLQAPLRSLDDLAVLLGFKTVEQQHLKVAVTDSDGKPLPGGTKIHLWHASADVQRGFPGGMYDNGAREGLPTLKALLQHNKLPATVRLVDKYQFGRCYQVPDPRTQDVRFEAPVPGHYDIGTDPETGEKMTRAMHYHLSVELPQGYEFDPTTDVDGNGIFQTQLYFAGDPHAEEDRKRFGPESGFTEERVIPDSGEISVRVKLRARDLTLE